MTITLSGYKIKFINLIELLSIYKDLFLSEEYKFKSKKKRPFIIDCGSHIGLSILYFKKKYPSSKIIAFEANPDTFKILSGNMKTNHIKGVEVLNFALAAQQGTIPFYVAAGKRKGWNWGDAGVKNSWYNKNDYKTINVPSQRLSKYINSTVDLLKIDIEGMESIVLFDIAPKLKYVKEIILEFHGSKQNKQNNLEKIIDLLEKNDFAYSFERPFSILNRFRNKYTRESLKKAASYFLIIRAKKISF